MKGPSAGKLVADCCDVGGRALNRRGSLMPAAPSPSFTEAEQTESPSLMIGTGRRSIAVQTVRPQTVRSGASQSNSLSVINDVLCYPSRGPRQPEEDLYDEAQLNPVDAALPTAYGLSSPPGSDVDHIGIVHDSVGGLIPPPSAGVPTPLSSANLFSPPHSGGGRKFYAKGACSHADLLSPSDQLVVRPVPITLTPT